MTSEQCYTNISRSPVETSGQNTIHMKTNHISNLHFFRTVFFDGIGLSEIFCS